MAIALSHGGSNIYSSPTRSEELLVGTKEGVVIFKRNSGAGWDVVHRALPDQFISSMIIEPESKTIFAGSFYGTVHASTDGGRTWERRDNGLSVHDVYSLASVKLNGQVRIYAGTEPAHLFYSEDLGHHWTELPSLRSVPSTPQWSFPAPPHIAHTKFITFDPFNPAKMYVCIEQGALLRSEDAGQTWKELNTVGFFTDKNRPAEHFYDVHKAIIHPQDSKRIFVSGGAGLYVSADGGGSWERWTSSDWASDVYPDGLVLDPNRPDTMFVSAAEHNPSTWRQSKSPVSGTRIYRTTDGGRSWNVLSDGLTDRMKHEVGALCLESYENSSSVFFANTGGDVYGSDDGGDHWSLIHSGLAPVSKKGHERLLRTA